MSIEHVSVEVVAAFAVIIGLTAVLRPICRHIGQPVVVGQILVGILLGPSVLGRLPWHLTGRIFPPDALPYLSVIARIGLVFFLFSVGCELDLRLLRSGVRTVMIVSGGALILPLALGAGIGLAEWYGVLPGAVRARPEFATVLFFAVALSITAVPVLAAILRESALLSTRAGAVALASAGAMDLVGWLLLAAAVAAAGAGRPVATELAYSAAYILVMVVLIRPALHWWMRRPRAARDNRTSVVLAAVLASAWATGFAGLNVIFGALLLGALMPRTSAGRCEANVREAAAQTGDLLMPLFFVVTGLSVNIGALHGSDFAALALLTATAVAGKVLGGALAARSVKLGRRESAVIGILLSTRGLTELIVITAGRTAGLIDARGYTLLVLMALITTALTGPLLHLVQAPRLVTAAAQHALAASVPALLPDPGQP
jgi:Kef-type K+ transport system membrane component KefB